MREHKKFQGPKRPASIDGMVSDGRRLGVPTHRSYQPDRGVATPSLDSLVRREEGFHPIRQSTSGSLNELPDDEAILNEPIVLDDQGDKSRKNRHLGTKHHKHPRLRKVLKRGALLIGVALLCGAAYLGYKVYHTQKQVLSGGGQAPAVCDGNVPVDQLKTEGDSRVNILLLGIGGDGHEAPDLTDTIMIASLDPVNKKLGLLSVPRDLWVKIPGDGSRKINEAYYFGKTSSKSTDINQKRNDGIKSADQTLEAILGIPIHYNALVNFKAFQDIVNALGGVDINVPKDEAVHEVLWVENTSQHYTLDVQSGPQHFDGTRALYFARSRHTSTRGDFDRAERQRSLIVAIRDKALSAGTFTNPIRISQLLDGLGNNVYTDFDSGSIKCLYKEISEVQSSNIKSLDLVTPPSNLLVNGNIPGVSTLAPKEGLFTYDAIQDYVHKALRDSFLAKENASVAVYNATSTAGLATTQTNTLKSVGYNVTTTASLPTATNPAKTVVVDLSKGANKYTRNYLERRYNTSAVTSMPAGTGLTPPVGTQFVIILGKDASSTSN
ncbi:LCP family protein [Candidatus Saccharibacteria bacterium]|nr:LCP family protein [Candidatus Saccharibacteria bacterium]